VNNVLSFEREQKLVRLLISFIAVGLVFMVLPGTFLGVWNLFAISGGHSASSVPATWIQAHGHAQVFGWVGTFILGISFYTLPNLRRITSPNYAEGWLMLALWTLGVTGRWFAGVYLIGWRFLLPSSALLELAAFCILLWMGYRSHEFKPEPGKQLPPFVPLFLSGVVGLALSLLLLCYESFTAALSGAAPVVPAIADAKLVVLETWGFAVPVAWAYTAKWMPVFLGLRKPHLRMVGSAALVNLAAIFLVLADQLFVATLALTASSVLIILGLNLWVPAEEPAKITGVHKTFPLFIRLAYGWLLVADLLIVISALLATPAGITGAARHALTVGFLATMVFSVAPRMLPAFFGRKGLYSARLMFWATLVLNCGCALRVVSEMVAYHFGATVAWIALPISASLELTAVVLFAINMFKTMAQPPLLAELRGGPS